MKKKRIVVMGGSFNPPTIAHFRIMQAALDAVNAEKGFFVPVSFPYLKRKMAKLNQSQLCLPDELRIAMLEAMMEADARMDIYKEDMNKAFSDDAGLMAAVQERYPDADIYSVFGDDKLDLLDLFSAKHSYFDRFRCILFSRDSANLTEAIESRAHLAAYKHAFVMVDALDGMDQISSTRIREHLFDIDAVADMLHPSSLPMLRELKKEDFPQEILRFKDEYAFLSNDYPAPVMYEDIVYPCVTSAFLAAKLTDRAEKIRISRQNVESVKRKYSAVPSEIAEAAVMEEIVRLKFRRHPALADELLKTGDCRLINGGKNKKYWGVNLITWEGENVLGNILMKVRGELKEGIV